MLLIVPLSLLVVGTALQLLLPFAAEILRVGKTPQICHISTRDERRVIIMTKQEMLKAMCLELSQADLKAIGQSRGFDPQTVASRALLEHVFLSEQGLPAAVASLTEAETLGLHLLNCLGEAVGLDF